MIMSFAHARTLQQTPGEPRRIAERDVIFNGQLGGDTLVGGCGSTSSTKSIRSSNPNNLLVRANTCQWTKPPADKPIRIEVGSPSPVCSFSSGCGKSCGGGFYCKETRWKRNPDYEDPRNPDSVQNPQSDNYGDWEGKKQPELTVGTGKTVVRMYLAYDFDKPSAPDDRKWYVMAEYVNGARNDVCDTKDGQIAVWSANGGMDPRKPPLFAGSTNLDMTGGFPGYRNCKFEGVKGTPGSIKCDNTYRFDCKADETFAQTQCKAADYRGQHKLTSVQICAFPEPGE